jgi:AcrR family transcriptional regulator
MLCFRRYVCQGSEDMPESVHARAPRRASRLAKQEREAQIVRGAIPFFARNGFSATTRELASHLGIVHGLLYRYFPSKEALVERVYQEVFEKVWKQEWVELMQDRSRPLRDRLIAFSLDYSSTLRKNEWVRMFLLAGFEGLQLPHRYRALIRNRLFPLVIEETRRAFGADDKTGQPLSDAEYSLMYVLHGGLFYIDIGKWAFGTPREKDDTPQITNLVDIFLAGAEDFLGKDTQASAKPGRSVRRGPRPTE